MDNDFNKRKRKALLYAIILTLLIAILYIIFAQYEKVEKDSNTNPLNGVAANIKEAFQNSSSSIKTGRELINNKN